MKKAKNLLFGLFWCATGDMLLLTGLFLLPIFCDNLDRLKELYVPSTGIYTQAIFNTNIWDSLTMNMYDSYAVVFLIVVAIWSMFCRFMGVAYLKGVTK